MTSRKNVIAGRPKVVWDHTDFLPAIHYQPPRIPFGIPWFQLQPALRFIKHENFLPSQSSATVDILILKMILDWRLRSSSFTPFTCTPRYPWSIDACPPSKSMTTIYFSLQASGVSSLNSWFLQNGYLPKWNIYWHLSLENRWLRWISALRPSRVLVQHSTFVFSWSSRSINMCPFGSNGQDSLHLFRLREFQTPMHSFLP